VTASKGAAWGERGPQPSGTIEAGDDQGARQAVERVRKAGEALPPLRLTSGDLWRTVGGPHPGTQRDALVLPADLGVADLDGEERCFVAHLVVRRWWWRGRLVAVMNAQFLGTWDVAPRSHPNDGRLDVVDVAPSLSGIDRWRAGRRLPSGTHVPHPSITVRQTSTWATTFDEPTPVWLDGERVGEVVELTVQVEPDALVLVM
jgi:hypothetical protein